MRPLLLLVLVLAVGCSSTPRLEVREIPLTPEERQHARAVVRYLEDESDKAIVVRDREIRAMQHARGIDEHSGIDLERGVWIAPVTSAP